MGSAVFSEPGPWLPDACNEASDREGSDYTQDALFLSRKERKSPSTTSLITS